MYSTNRLYIIINPTFIRISIELITEFNMNKNVYYYMLPYYNKSNIYKNINGNNYRI